jgi:hypothetical protein
MMPVGYIAASLPRLVFGQTAPMSLARFEEITGGVKIPEQWRDLETQLRNAIAEARGGIKHRRPAAGCSLFWKNRILACFQEKDVAKREEMIDQVWWDAAEELTPPSSPLGEGALATYAVRLEIAIKRAKISADRGNAAFDRLTAETRIDRFENNEA